jgi:hypothetical protein
MKICRSCFLVVVVARPISARDLRLGVEAVAWSASVARESTGACGQYYGDCSSQRIYNHPAAFGATVSYGLPHSLAVTVATLYGRITHDAVSQIRSISSVSSAVAAKTSINRWTFPILLKYRLTRNRVAAPFIAGGFSVDAISNGSMSGNICSYSTTGVSAYGCSPLASAAPDPARRAIMGGVIGGGTDIKLPVGTLSLELRLTRWGDTHFTGVDSPPLNEVQTVFGITF